VAETITVGTLRALLTVDTAKFEGGMKGAEQSTDKLGATAERVGKQVDKMANSLKGDRIIGQANAMAAAIQKAGGVARLTDTEMRRMGGTIGEALNKYKALGIQAPASLQAMHKALVPARTQLDAVAMGMSAAGKEASASGRMIAGMGASGRAAAESLRTSLAPVTPQLGLMNQGVAALKTNFSQMFGAMALANVASNAVMALVGNVGSLIAQGAKMRGLEQSFERLTAGIGETGEAMLEVTRGATEGLVTDLSLVQSMNKAILLGLPVTRKEMGELAKTATVLGRAMGQDATKSLDDLITALGRSSPLILDNLGLTVKVGEANEEYARKLGKSVEQLTEAEKKTAFYNAAMEVARQRTDELGGSVDSTASGLQRMGVAWDNFWNKVGSGGDKALGTLFGVMSNPRGIMDFLPGRNEAAARFNQDFIASATGSASMIGAPGFRVASPTFGTPFAAPDGREDINDYKAKLIDAQAAVRGLTAAQREQLDAALKLGGVSKEFLATLGLTDGALRLYTASTKGGSKATDELTKAKQDAVEWSKNLYDKTAALNLVQEDAKELFQESAPAVEAYALALKEAGERAGFISGEINELNNLKLDTLFQEPTEALGDYFESLERGPSRFGLMMDDIVGTFSWGIGEMAVGLKGFKDTWTDIWDGIRQSFANVLSGMLNDFLGGFLRKIVGGATGMSLGGSLFGGGAAAAASGLTAAQMSTPAIGSLLGATGGGTAAGAAGGAAGGGLGATITGLATNPFTIAAAGGLLLGLAVWKKGLFRGGWEGIEGNQRRDKHLLQWGPAGTGPGSGFHNLAAFLTGQTGEAGGGRIFRDFQSDNEGRFESAQAAIVSMAAKSGKKIQSFSMGGFVPPGAVVPAVLHGGSRGEMIMPLAKLAEMMGNSRPVVIHNQWNVSAVDAQGVSRFVESDAFTDRVAFIFEQNRNFVTSRTSRAMSAVAR
jgi:hypothetical protein